MKQRTGLAALFMGALATLPLSAGIIVISQPNSTYTSTTTLLPVTAAELSNTSSVNDASLTASFSALLQVAFVPTDWLNWGSSPAVENSTPTVLITPGTSATLLTITFSQALSVFGLEASPDAFGPNTMTETFYNGGTNLGSIVLSPDGSLGALLFAASSTTPITRVTITAANTDFAIGDLRYALAAPEPGTWMELGAGLAVLAAYARRRRNS